MSTDPHDIRITQYVFDELNDADKIAFETEMEQDPQLRQLVEETQATVGSLQAELQGEPVVGLTEQQRQAIEAGITNPGSVTPGGEQVTAPSPGKTWVGLALAASLLLAFSVGIYRYSQPAATQVAVMDPTADSRRAVTGDHSTKQSRTDQVVSEPLDSRPFSEESLEKPVLKRDFADKDEAAGLGPDLPALGISAHPGPEPISVDATTRSKRLNGLRQAEGGKPLDGSRPLLPPGRDQDLGRGPGEGGDRFDRIYENRFLAVTDKPL
ncbi:MAG: hypothetical protein ABGX05_04705, partial [Pirellulaceae bacterium]